MSLLYIPLNSPITGKFTNVTNANGAQKTFSDPFPYDNDPMGDYDLTIHCYPDSNDQTEQGEVSYSVTKSPEGFFVRPSEDCELVTYSVTADTEPTVEGL